jgi:hypothetical protein
MDQASEAKAKKALRLYKQGHYEEAAILFAELSVDHADMLIFGRNLGACYYYLRKPDPALSNLRFYLGHKQDIAPDDKAVVTRWIDEMEQQRRASVAAPTAPAAILPDAGGPPVAPPESQDKVPATAAPTLATPVLASGAVLDHPVVIEMTPPTPPVSAEATSRPFYARWWFWTAIGVVAAGSVSILLLANQGGSRSVCPGGVQACDSIKP